MHEEVLLAILPEIYQKENWAGERKRINFVIRSAC